MPAYSFPFPPANLTIDLRRLMERSPTILRQVGESEASVTGLLVPLIIGAKTLD